MVGAAAAQADHSRTIRGCCLFWQFEDATRYTFPRDGVDDAKRAGGETGGRRAGLQAIATGLAMAKPLRVLRKVEGEAAVEPASKTTNSPVVLQAAATATATLRLENRASVTRRQVVHGVQRGEIDPVMLVRAASDNMWWVQDRVQRDAEGAFTGLVRFGNEKTPAGSEFHLLALTPRSSSDATLYQVGDSLKELPKDAIVSAELTLVLAVNDAPGAE